MGREMKKTKNSHEFPYDHDGNDCRGGDCLGMAVVPTVGSYTPYYGHVVVVLGVPDRVGRSIELGFPASDYDLHK